MSNAHAQQHQHPDDFGEPPADLHEVSRLLDALAACERSLLPAGFSARAATVSASSLRAEQPTSDDAANGHFELASLPCEELGECDRQAAPEGLERRIFAASVGALRRHAPEPSAPRRLSAPTRRRAITRWGSRIAAAVVLVGAITAMYVALPTTPQHGDSREFAALTPEELSAQLEMKLEPLYELFGTDGFREELTFESGDSEDDPTLTDMIWSDQTGS